MDDAPDSQFVPGPTPYGPPAGAIPPPAAAPVPAAASAPAPSFPPPAAATEMPRPDPYAVAPQKPSRAKNGFGVASVWIGSFALLFAATARGFSVFGVLLTLLAAVFGVLALVNVNRLGKPRVAATVGTSLTALAVLATAFWALAR